MTVQAELVAATRKRLRELDEERAELVAVLKRHGVLVVEHSSAPPSGKAKHATRKVARKAAPSHSSNGAKAPVTLAQQRGAKAFQKMVGGPTEIVLGVLRDKPSGLTYSEVVELALPSVQSYATNPAKSVGNVLLALKKRNRVVFQEGRYYPQS